MILDEIFNTNLPIMWQTNGRYELGEIQFNTATYVVQIEKKPIHAPGLAGKKTAEVSFYLNIDDSEKAHSTQNAKTSPFALYGSVANGLMDKFKDFDVFYFVANRRHSDDDVQFQQKKQIYFALADRMCKFTGAKFYEKTVNGDYECMVSKIPLTVEGFVIEREEALKAFNASRGNKC